MQFRRRIWVFAGALALLFCLALLNIAAAQDLRAQATSFEQQGRLAEAEATWKTIAQADPKDAEAYAHLGLIEAHQEQYPEAIENYRKALALNPAMPNLQMNLGLALFKAGQFPDAIKAFNAEMKKHPGDQRLTILLGMSHFAMKDYLVAIPYIRRAAEADPQSLPLRLTLAHACMWSKQYQCVLDVYKQILTLNADSAEADMLAGEALDATGDDAGAVTQFRAAVKANPKEPNAHFGLGYLLWTQHHYDEAIPEFQAELENDSSHLQARAYLADCRVELGDYDKALPDLEQVAASEQTAAAPLEIVHRDLGIVYASLGRNEEAAEQLQKAIAIDPKDVSPHWRLGKLYQAMGKKQEAKAEFDIASNMNKQNSRPLAQEIESAQPKAQQQSQ